jgi:hypothetical protein
MSRPLVCVALALLPMAFSLAGVAIDEHQHLGYSTWLSACRAAGPSLASVARFTLELLPSAVIGMLAGGLVLLLIAVGKRRDRCATRAAWAAHSSCAMATVVGLLLCALALPVPLMLATEALLTAAAAVWLLRRSRTRPTVASVKPPTGSLTSAQ